MIKDLRKSLVFFLSVAACMFMLHVFGPMVCAQQNDGPVPFPKTDGRRDNDPEAATFNEMVMKQQISRRKKEHEELLKRGEEALKLSADLQTSFNANETFSSKDLEKLQELEKVVGKIREELGGDNDDDDETAENANGPENNARQSVGSAFKFLRDSTVKLVDELKKSSRFSISAIAIEASTRIIRVVKFLRLKK